MMTTCPHCGTMVLPREDGACPQCEQRLPGGPVEEGLGNGPVEEGVGGIDDACPDDGAGRVGSVGSAAPEDAHGSTVGGVTMSLGKKLVLAVCALLVILPTSVYAYHLFANSSAKSKAEAFKRDHPEWFAKHGGFALVSEPRPGYVPRLVSLGTGRFIRDDCVVEFPNGDVWEQKDQQVRKIRGSFLWRLGIEESAPPK